VNDIDHTKARLQEWECKCLLAEYNSRQEDIRMCAQFHRKDIHLSIIVIGAVLAVSHTSTDFPSINCNVSSLASDILPSVMFVFYLLQIISFHWENVMVRHCARIERLVNDLSHKNLMDWESFAAKKYIRKLTAPTMFSGIALMAFFLVVFVLFSVEAYSRNNGGLFNIIHLIQFFIMIAMSATTLYYEFTETKPDAISEHAESIVKNAVN
jgi:hypothetical protein